MDIGNQQYLIHASCKKKDHCAAVRLQRSRIMYVLPKQRRKRRRALTIFGRLIGQQLASTAIFNMAESIVKRIKTYLMDGWARRYLPKSTHFLTTKSMSEKVNDKEVDESVDSSDKQHVPRDCVQDTQAEMLACFDGFNTNINAKSSHTITQLNIPDRKLCNMRARRLVARSIARPRLKQFAKPMDGKSHIAKRISQHSKRFVFLQNKCARFERKDKLMTPTEIVAPLQLVEAVDINSEQNQTCKTVPLDGDIRAQDVKFSLSKNVQNEEQWETASGKDIKGEIVKKNRMGKNRRTRRKTEALLNMFVVQPHKEVNNASKEIKQNLPRKKSTPIRRRCEFTHPVIAPQPKIGPSVFSFKTSSTDMNDWPSLTESERPKGLIKEAAKEIVRTKYAGSVARNARKLLAGIATVKTNDLEPSRQTTSCFGLTNQQSDTNKIAAKPRTWASVAAQSLASPAKLIYRHDAVPTALHPDPAKSIDNTLVYKSPSRESAKMLKRLLWSKLDCPNKLWSDRCKGKEKPSSRKYLMDVEDRAKLSKNLKCRKSKIKERSEQKDQAPVTSASHKNRKLNRTERSEAKIEKIKIRANTVKLKSNQPKTWQTDKIPILCLQPIDHVIITPHQSGSESKNVNVDESFALTSVNAINNMPVTVDTIENTVTFNASHLSLGLCSLSDKLSNESININDHFCSEKQSSAIFKPGEISWINRSQRTSPTVEDADRHKKVSARYRALLRGESGRLDAKSATEKQTRSKKTDSMKQDKITILTKQFQQRQERQRTHNNSRHSPEIICAEKLTKNIVKLPADSSCPYWLRSRPYRTEFMQLKPPSMFQSNNQTCVKIENVDTNNSVTTLTTNSTPCRRSERLNAKSAVKITCPAASCQ